MLAFLLLGARLVAGSVNLEQPLTLRVERAGAATKAAAIARLVERAAASRPALVAAADRIAHVLTWVVLATAAAAGLAWQDPWVAIAVLVATCPCALALAAPIALTSAAGLLLERGVALGRAAALETLARATDIVLDKTGTLTAGRFSIAHIERLGSASEAECFAAARSLEAGSRHPLAGAFITCCAPSAATAMKNFPGQGVEGSVGGRRLRIGTEAFCRSIAAHVSPAVAASAAGSTPVFLAGEQGVLAVFHLVDLPRTEAAAALFALRAQGLELHLLSGDHPAAVEAAGLRLGIASRTGGATPQVKLAYVERLQREGRIVAMVGDGLNDAPVLARANVSFAMGGGADAAQREADLVLLKDEIAELGRAVALARSAMRIVRQNFAWALGYNAIALPLAALHWIGPLEAAIGMAASSFIVVLNAMRVGTAGRPFDLDQKGVGIRMVQSPRAG
jgi:Cu2+-exporting ATPase